MTPKEKARELFNKYWDLLALHNVLHRRLFTKECALIAVDEIIKANHIWYIDSIPYKYWHQVKQEINNL